MSTAVLTISVMKRRIAKNVRRLRGRRSLYWLAKAAKTQVTAVREIETCRRVPSALLLARLANAFEVAVDDILK